MPHHMRPSSAFTGARAPRLTVCCSQGMNMTTASHLRASARPLAASLSLGSKPHERAHLRARTKVLRARPRRSPMRRLRWPAGASDARRRASRRDMGMLAPECAVGVCGGGESPPAAAAAPAAAVATVG
eukprot:6201862-Pleurochrysis_carterae.AAC.1